MCEEDRKLKFTVEVDAHEISDPDDIKTSMLSALLEYDDVLNAVITLNSDSLRVVDLSLPPRVGVGFPPRPDSRARAV